jgi:hypothetical protein
MNGRFQMQGGKNWFLPKEMNANRFFWDSHWLEIWSNHFYPSMGPNGGSVAMDRKRKTENERQFADGRGDWRGAESYDQHTTARKLCTL